MDKFGYLLVIPELPYSKLSLEFVAAVDDGVFALFEALVLLQVVCCVCSYDLDFQR
jgi:hypothetical protein